MEIVSPLSIATHGVNWRTNLHRGQSGIDKLDRVSVLVSGRTATN